ncbi:helix-turn-helix domain-containing protein [Aurantibacillus circumpalustris]|uniref:helix-turn-helix domain-containing protein n=1 Tax=Aurantibacillus circumpalustris TaxID=3036359 RepID=UPI00295B9D0F|nr:helix-turn-helix domain-containing protein [Aurantibacillus circumpalustris]
MAIDIVTKEDLQLFRAELIKEIKLLVNPNTQTKKWLKSPEVRELLGISPGTLQNLRINGTLKFTRVGSIIYYAMSDIQKVLDKNEVDNSNGRGL